MNTDRRVPCLLHERQRDSKHGFTSPPHPLTSWWVHHSLTLGTTHPSKQCRHSHRHPNECPPSSRTPKCHRRCPGHPVLRQSCASHPCPALSEKRLGSLPLLASRHRRFSEDAWEDGSFETGESSVLPALPGHAARTTRRFAPATRR